MRTVEFISALFDGRVLVAMGVYTLLAATEPFLERWVERVFHDNPPALWFQTHLGLPLLRAACVVVFIYLAYPALFGLRSAPDLGTLLAGHAGATSLMLGIAFLVALLAPAVPVLYRHPELVLPLQGMLATSLLFDWLTDYLHMSAIRPWPGGDVLLVVVLGAWLMHRLARGIGQRLGSWVDAANDTSGYDLVAVHVVTLLAQLPLILVYGAGLGVQIAI